jgi:hypothetical protein
MTVGQIVTRGSIEYNLQAELSKKHTEVKKLKNHKKLIKKSNQKFPQHL